MACCGQEAGKLKAKQMRNFIVAILIFSLFLTGAYALAEETADEFYLKGRFAEAEKAYARSDMDHPKDLRYRYNRGCAAFQKSDYKGARAAFESVIRRTKDKELSFKASYNLGNTAFRSGDFEGAAAHYKKAIQVNRDNEDARYNLELSLRELKKQKEKAKKEPKQPQGPGDQKDKKGDRSQEGQEGQSDEKAPPGQEKTDKADKGDKESRKDPQREDGNRQGLDRMPKEEKEDLAGELKPRQGMAGDEAEEERSGKPPQAGVAAFDRKKAEALLDNLKEDRSRFLRFQVPEGKKQGVRSGKDW
jgi:Ca-activated chloride channel family protein